MRYPPHRKRILGVQNGVEITSGSAPTQQDLTDPATIYFRWTASTGVEIIMRRKLTASVWETGVARGLWAGRTGLTYTPITQGA